MQLPETSAPLEITDILIAQCSCHQNLATLCVYHYYEVMRSLSLCTRFWVVNRLGEGGGFGWGGVEGWGENADNCN